MGDDVTSHDERLRELVAPAGWRNPQPRTRYDLVVVGGGTGGLVSAAIAVGLGARVALVERAALGGDCLNTGCVPSKSLLASAKAVAHGGTPDFTAAMERMRRIRAEIAEHDSAKRFAELGVHVFLGDARFTESRTVEVRGEGHGQTAKLRFRRAIIATGARPVVPNISGLAAADPLTTVTVWDLTELPPRLAVVGGGATGCELAQAFARLGARVLLVESEPRILPLEDAAAAGVVAQALRDDGVAIVSGRTIERVEPRGAAAVLQLSGGDLAPLEVDRILVAAGRAPNVEELGLDEAGVAFDAGRGVHVDERLRTTNRRVYAVGDVASTIRFTHLADAHARVAVRNALFPGSDRVFALVPRCAYTDPELAHVGHTAESAARDGIEVTTLTQPFVGVDRAILEGETEGFARIHVRKGSDEIVGATVVGAHAGETIAEAAVAIAAGIGLKELSGVIHAYPTRAEALRKLADAHERTRFTTRARRLVDLWLRVSRLGR